MLSCDSNESGDDRSYEWKDMVRREITGLPFKEMVGTDCKGRTS